MDREDDRREDDKEWRELSMTVNDMISSAEKDEAREVEPKELGNEKERERSERTREAGEGREVSEEKLDAKEEERTPKNFAERRAMDFEIILSHEKIHPDVWEKGDLTPGDKRKVLNEISEKLAESQGGRQECNVRVSDEVQRGYEVKLSMLHRVGDTNEFQIRIPRRNTERSLDVVAAIGLANYEMYQREVVRNPGQYPESGDEKNMHDVMLHAVERFDNTDGLRGINDTELGYMYSNEIRTAYHKWKEEKENEQYKEEYRTRS